MLNFSDEPAVQRSGDMADANTPVIPLPNPGEGGPVAPGDDTDTPVSPLPNPGEGGPVYPGGSADVPTIPLPNPGEGGPVYPGNGGGTPVIPLPNPGEGGPVYPGNNAGGQGTIVIPNRPSTARVRFLNATYGYPAFQILVGNAVAVNFLGRASISPYRYYYGGYRTVTVRGTDGYIYIQKTLPFDAGSTSTIAVILRAGGLDLLQISDRCCPPTGYYSNFRVSNLAYNSAPIDVLLADGRVVYADVRFKETTSYKRIRPGTYEFLFAETNLTPSPVYADIETLDSAFLGTYPIPNMVASAYVVVSSRANYTVFLLNSGSDAIQTMVVEDQ